jgi:putative transposase
LESDQSAENHRDRGVQYVSIKYTERLAEARIESSVGSVGDSYDNGIETIDGLYGAAPAVKFGALEGVDWFNSRRFLASIGQLPRADAEAAYYAQLEVTRVAA